jgi:acyl dehydratase
LTEAAPYDGPPEPDSLAATFFDDMSVGSRWVSHRRTITESDLAAFTGLSGDFNPLHVDDIAAADGPFGRRVAHGALVLSIATGLRQQMGVFHGSMKAFLELRSWKFLKPVFVGDTITAVTTVVSTKETSSPDQGVVVQRVDVVNQDGGVVQSGELVSLIKRRRS